MTFVYACKVYYHKNPAQATAVKKVFLTLISLYRIYWCIMDGADVNRQFIKIHFKGKDAAKEKFMAENIYTGNPMIFIMDPKVITLCNN